MQIEETSTTKNDLTNPDLTKVTSKLEDKVDSINDNYIKDTDAKESKDNLPNDVQVKSNKKRTAFEQQFYF